MSKQRSEPNQPGKPELAVTGCLGAGCSGDGGKQRIDKWLWHARVVKTRTLAQKLVNGGKVRVNREKVLAASALVKAGDVMTIALRSHVRVLRIKGFSERRGSAPLAQTLFEDLTVASEAAGTATNPESGPEFGRESEQGSSEAGQRQGGGDRHPEGHPGGQGIGRPSKHDRRKLADLKKIDVS